ncbi:MAG: T9SS type A sorting domain-containing protein [Candidatus Cloacimonetes bacterium]|nr:T9SS type A sorting domain-containing protein [Candidatus Cloacimonadota bacterium]
MSNVDSNYRYVRCRKSGSGWHTYSEIEVIGNIRGLTTETEEEIPEFPNIYSLSPNYPNPFNPETTIDFSLKETDNVSLKVYNIKGQLVKTLVNEKKETGNHSIVWNGKDNNDRKVSSGVYFYQINADEFTDVKKMMMIK